VMWIPIWLDPTLIAFMDPDLGKNANPEVSRMAKKKR